eukprot:TRINITY_DN13871_c0_g2_i1.p1 TRINITY_DN13871_c0_g2~~TRINITY_DN13871_c0_g2_i1.p1  ORF type:complete len:792 (+),score=94.25 TRINITY_DN13871_c0_g2_i1:57-2432(+)
MDVEYEVDYLDTAVPVEVPLDATVAELAAAALAAVGCDYAPSECALTAAALGADVLEFDGNTQVAEVGIGPGERLTLTVHPCYVAQRLWGDRSGPEDVTSALQRGDAATARVILAALGFSASKLEDNARAWYAASLEVVDDGDACDAVRALLDGGVPHAFGTFSLLARAAAEQRLAVVLMLLGECRMDPNLRDARVAADPDVVPLAAALLRQHAPGAAGDETAAKVTAALLEAGADVHAHFPCVDIDSRAACTECINVVGAVAKRDEHGAPLRAVLALGGSPDKRPAYLPSPLALAAEQSSPAAVRVLLEAGCDVNPCGPHPLGTASNAEVARLLVAAGSDLKIRPAWWNDDGCRSRMYRAVTAGDDVFLDALLAAPSAPAMVARHSWDLVSRARRASTVALLHGAGADTNAAPPNDYAYRHRQTLLPPLCDAVRRGDVPLVRALLDGARSKVRISVCGTTPLHIAVQRGDSAMVRMLLSHRTWLDPNARNVDRDTPMHAAARAGDGDVIQALLDHGAKANTRDADGLTPLHVAVRTGGFDAVMSLLLHASKSHVNWKTWDGDAALHIAARAGDESMVSALLKYGHQVDVDLRSKNGGLTPLRVAVQKGHYGVVSTLLDYGASFDRPGADGLSALDAMAGTAPGRLRGVLDRLSWRETPGTDADRDVVSRRNAFLCDVARRGYMKVLTDITKEPSSDEDASFDFLDAKTLNQRGSGKRKGAQPRALPPASTSSRVSRAAAYSDVTAPVTMPAPQSGAKGVGVGGRVPIMVKSSRAPWAAASARDTLSAAQA